VKPLTLNLTRSLLRWLRQDEEWARMDWRTRASLLWRAHWGSLNLRQSQALVERRTTPIEPLLILGPWRCGTTAMHEMLSNALGYPTPLTWQCMNASTFALSGSPSAGRSVARPMDGIEVNALTPQEDEFALLTMGVASAYQAFWMPHRLSQLTHTLDQSFWLQSSDWLASWDFFLNGVLGPASSRRILLKSPNHTFRLQAILRRYPETRVVWMLRDPLEVYDSNVKMWQLMTEEHGLTALDRGELDRFLAAALRASADALRWALDHMPPKRLVCCVQAELRMDPERVLAQVLDALRLDDGMSRQASGPVARPWTARREQSAGDSISPELMTALEVLHQAQRDAMERRD
jgi:omega-hydroxy-beta-dihydromenaquinone-9 sulfotransferase